MTLTCRMSNVCMSNRCRTCVEPVSRLRCPNGVEELVSARTWARTTSTISKCIRKSPHSPFPIPYFPRIRSIEFQVCLAHPQKYSRRPYVLSASAVGEWRAEAARVLRRPRARPLGGEPRRIRNLAHCTVYCDRSAVEELVRWTQRQR